MSNEAKTSRAMRLFIAVNIPPAVRDAIYGDAEPLRAATNAVRWVSPSALHVTLKFLGEQNEARVALLREAIESVATRHASVAVETTDIRGVPKLPASPRRMGRHDRRASAAIPGGRH